MQIHQIIRERRLAKHLTQEQLADRLGVTAPAVNKWEKAASYPDITLLPALARLLDTDLNTLLGFQAEMSKQEVALFLNTLSEVLHQQGFAAGYALAQDQLRQYPSCGPLLCGSAMTLEGALTLYPPKDGREEEYRAQIDAFYSRAADGPDPAIREQALSQQIRRRMEQRDYTAAQALLNKLPDPSSVDKGQIEAELLIAQGDLPQAAQLFDLWEYDRYLPYFQLYEAQKDRAGQLRVLLPMLRSLSHPWETAASPLYRHIPQKPVEKDLGTRMTKALLRMMQAEDPELVQQSPELQKLWEEAAE